MLSIHQVKQLAKNSPVPLEVFAFGSLCIMAEGRCYLSSYLTGESPNTVGACSPARFVRWQQTEEGMESRLNNVLIDRYQKMKMPVIQHYVKDVILSMNRNIMSLKSPPASILLNYYLN